MPHDINDEIVAIGDKVLVECEVKEVSQGETACNVLLVPTVNDPQRDVATSFWLNTKQVEKTESVGSFNEPTEVDVLTSAKRAYDAYCVAVGGVAFNGDPLPKSDEFFADPNKVKQSNAWIEAIKAIS